MIEGGKLQRLMQKKRGQIVELYSIHVWEWDEQEGREETNEQRRESSLATLQSLTKVLLLDGLHLLLQEFQDLFSEPHSLPPKRVLNHSIHLKPNSLPVNIRAYRCSPIKKPR